MSDTVFAKLEIVEAVVVEASYGPDTIILHTKLPSPTFPSTGTFSLKGHAAKGTGRAFVREHFGIEAK